MRICIYIQFFYSPVPRSIPLAHTDEDSLAALSASGHPATFGQNHEDVFDETYRKARVLNKDQFSLKFTPEGAGLEPIIRKALAIGEGRGGVEFELYKLNVYGTSISTSVLFMDVIKMIVYRSGIVLQSAPRYTTVSKHVRVACHCLPDAA